jgi:hypothetical protein
MRSRASCFLRCAVTLLGLAVATQACSGGSTSAVARDGGSDATAGESTAAACQSYVEAYLPCSTDEVVSVQRLVQACEDLLTFPGISITPAELEACASAERAAGCSQNQAEFAACTFTGSLPVGSACEDRFQCASGACSASVPDCGSCVATIPEGAPCNTAATCAVGTACEGGTCMKISFGGTGAPCDDLAHQCSSGSCDVGTNTCAAYVAPLPSGSACQSSGGPLCAAGLLCDTLSMECTPVTGADAGQRCVGGACVTIIPDGEPCNSSATTSTCDPPSNCVNGTCVFPYSVACK